MVNRLENIVAWRDRIAILIKTVPWLRVFPHIAMIALYQPSEQMSVFVIKTECHFPLSRHFVRDRKKRPLFRRRPGLERVTGLEIDQDWVGQHRRHLRIISRLDQPDEGIVVVREASHSSGLPPMVMFVRASEIGGDSVSWRPGSICIAPALPVESAVRRARMAIRVFMGWPEGFKPTSKPSERWKDSLPWM